MKKQSARPYHPSKCEMCPSSLFLPSPPPTSHWIFFSLKVSLSLSLSYFSYYLFVSVSTVPNDWRRDGMGLPLLANLPLHFPAILSLYPSSSLFLSSSFSSRAEGIHGRRATWDHLCSCRNPSPTAASPPFSLFPSLFPCSSPSPIFSLPTAHLNRKHGQQSCPCFSERSSPPSSAELSLLLGSPFRTQSRRRDQPAPPPTSLSLSLSHTQPSRGVASTQPHNHAPSGFLPLSLSLCARARVGCGGARD